MEIKSESNSESINKRKRIITFDFLRGVAIIGVIGFHVMKKLYDYKARLEADYVPMYYYILIIILGFFGSMYTLFLLISAIGNTFSIYIRWNKIVGESASSETGVAKKKEAYRKILKTQMIRAMMLIFFGYFSESVLNTMVLGLSVGMEWEEIEVDMMSALFHSQIISTIGFGVALSSFIILWMKKNDKTKVQIRNTLIIISLFFIFARPLVGLIYKQIPWYYNDQTNELINPKDIWAETHSAVQALVFFILSPYYLGWFPLFPNISMLLIGAAIGNEIMENNTKIDKNILNSMLKGSVFFIITGIIYAFTTDDRYMNNMLLPAAGALISIAILLYYIEVRGKGDKFAARTKGIRMLGNFTLTLWCLQWANLFPIMLIHVIYNAVKHQNTPFIDSIFWNQGLDGWSTWGVFFLLAFFWYMVMAIWRKFNFKGTLEWLVARIMGVKEPNLREKIENVESIISEQEGVKYYGKGVQALIWLYWVVVMVLTVAIQII